jgi:hypothetical protein
VDPLPAALSQVIMCSCHRLLPLNPEQAEQDAALLSGAFERVAMGDEGEDMAEEEEEEEEGLGNDEEQEAHNDHDGMQVDNPSGMWEENCFLLTLTPFMYRCTTH